MLSWVVWFLEVFGYVWSLGALALAGFIWFGAFTLPGWIRATAQQLAVALLVFAGCTYIMRTTYSDGIAAERADWVAKQRIEDDRRDQVLLQTQALFQDTLDALDDKNADLKAKNDEIERLSHAHDNDDCIAADGVSRLRGIR